MAGADSVTLVTATDTELTAEDRPMNPADWSVLLTLSLIWGGSFLFMAIGLESFEPGLVTLLRVGFGALTLLFIPAARQPVPREDWGKVALLGFTWMAFPLTMFPIAQQWIDSSVAGMLNSGMPLMTVLLAWLVFNTPTGPLRLFGVLVGFVGILFISIPEASVAGTNAAGVGLVLLAVSSYGLAVNIAGPLQREYGSLPVISRALGFAALLCVPFGLVDATASSFSWGSLAACAAVGIGGTGVAYALAGMLTGRVGAVRMSIVTYLIPIVSIVLGVVFRDETVELVQIVGLAAVLAAGVMVARR